MVSATKKEAIVIPRIPIDAGNRTIQFLDPQGSPVTIPAYYKPYESWEEPPQPGPSTVVIEYRGNDGTVHTYAVGKAAKDGGGVPIFTQLGGKATLLPQTALAAIFPNQQGAPIRVNNLVVAMPNARNADDVTNVKRAEGVHEFRRNGVPMVVSIGRVVPLDETVAAYQYGVRKEWFKVPGGINGILDFGGGTTIGQLFTGADGETFGTIMRDSSIILSGTWALAQAIQKRILSTTHYSIPLDLIMDGIANKSFMVGDSGMSFKNVFPSAHAEWLTAIRQKLNTEWGRFFQGDLKEVLVIGGSAPLIQTLVDQTNGRIKIAPEDPQTVSIRAMQSVTIPGVL